MVLYNVYVDISRKTKGRGNNTYKDVYGCVITLNRRDDPKILSDHNQLTGYKLYIHTLPTDSWFWSYDLGVINYRSIKQKGLGGYKKYWNSKDVSVYYWKNDEDNLLPLFIGINIDRKQTYFHKQSLTGDNWEKYNKSLYSHDFHFKNVLHKTFQDVVILNLNADVKSKYHGHPSGDEFKKIHGPNSNYVNSEYITIAVNWKNNTPCQGYSVFTHTPGAGFMYILSTWYGDKFLPFKDNLLKSQYTSATVYYVGNDGDKKRPLLLELKPVSGLEEFYEPNGNSWKQEFNVKRIGRDKLNTTLIQTLDKCACQKYDAIPINISSQIGSYKCKDRSCKGGHMVNVRKDQKINDGLEGYEAYTHKPLNGKSSTITRFRNGNQNVTIQGLTFPVDGTTEVTIYFPKCASGYTQILMYIDHGNGESKWYRTTNKENEWVEVGDQLYNARPNDRNKGKIISVLEGIVNELNIPGCKKNNSAKVEPKILPLTKASRNRSSSKCGMDFGNCSPGEYDDDGYFSVYVSKRKEELDSLETTILGKSVDTEASSDSTFLKGDNSTVVSIGGNAVDLETITSIVNLIYPGAGAMDKVEDTNLKDKISLMMTGSSKDTTSVTTLALPGIQGGRDTIIVGITPIPNRPGEYKVRLSNGSEALVIVNADGAMYALASPITAGLEGAGLPGQQGTGPNPSGTVDTGSNGIDGENGAQIDSGRGDSGINLPGAAGTQGRVYGAGLEYQQGDPKSSQDTLSPGATPTDPGSIPGSGRVDGPECATEAGTPDVSGSSDDGQVTRAENTPNSPPYKSRNPDQSPGGSQQDNAQSNQNAKNTRGEGDSRAGVQRSVDSSSPSSSEVKDGSDGLRSSEDVAERDPQALAQQSDGAVTDTPGKPEALLEPASHTDPAEPQAQSTSASGPGTPGLGPSQTGSGSIPPEDSTKIIVSVPAGILTTSALACFAGWKLYNRYKGDPWVRQI